MGIVDSSKEEWHLTPKGWVRGTSHYGNAPGPHDKVVKRPGTTVETWTLSMKQTHAMRPEKYRWDQTWVGKVPLEERKELRRKFRVPERHDIFPDVND